MDGEVPVSPPPAVEADSTAARVYLPSGATTAATEADDAVRTAAPRRRSRPTTPPRPTPPPNPTPAPLLPFPDRRRPTPSPPIPNRRRPTRRQRRSRTKHTYDEQPACSGVAIHEHRPSRLPINDCWPSHPSLIAQSSLVITITSYRTASASWTVNAGLGNITIFLAHGQFLGKNQIRRYRWPLERRGGLEQDAGLLLLAPSLGRPRRHCAPPLLAIADLARADASAPVTRRSRRRRRCRPSPSPSYPAAEAPATSSQGAGSPTGNQAQDFSGAELPRRRRHQAPSSPPPSSRMRMKMETLGATEIRILHVLDKNALIFYLSPSSPSSTLSIFSLRRHPAAACCSSGARAAACSTAVSLLLPPQLLRRRAPPLQLLPSSHIAPPPLPPPSRVAPPPLQLLPPSHVAPPPLLCRRAAVAASRRSSRRRRAVSPLRRKRGGKRKGKKEEGGKG
ncbi:uncharacterized protein [Oryza sativa Japonica Group]|uniref:uncharacterized protein n=1 Tax=Oryza sativa subsp. japonica TaxID=39947 RepID=UPI00339CA66B